MSNLLTWLHLSDLHARLRDDWDSEQIAEALVKDLKHLQKERQLRPDFLFFTGDLAFGASNGEKMADQYAKVRAFLDAARNAFNPPIPTRDVYLIPGNHDVDRGEITPDQTDWLRSTDRTLQEVITAMRDGKKQWRTWMDRLTAYRNFLTSYGLLHLQPDDPQLIWGDAKEIGGIRIGVAGFNSAWSCADKLDKGKIWCGADFQIARVKAMIGPADFSIALIHHPGNWFTEREDPSLMRRLRQEFPLVLHGHEHQDWVDVDTDGRILVSSGACYNSSWMPNGYSIGQIALDQFEGKLHLRQWDATGRGWVPRDVANKTTHGAWPLHDLKWLKSTSSGPLIVTTSVNPEDDTNIGDNETAGDYYTRRYCQYVIDNHDILELFGCDIPRELQRHQLSVAYVSLNLSPETDEESAQSATASHRAPLGRDEEDAKNENEDESDDFDESSAGIAFVLNRITSKASRLMIRGPAGAGKSTLLRWCAIHAARNVLANTPHSLQEPLDSVASNDTALKGTPVDEIEDEQSWKSKIPILIRLRDCPDGRIPPANDLPRFLAKHLPSAPLDWMTDILHAGRVLVLLDGVDEVHRDKRAQLADEIGELIRTYSTCTYVITTRPGAVQRGWLDRFAFTEARVEPMSRNDREEFIDKWYRSAALELRNRPRAGEDLTKTASRLKSELTDQPELSILASNPLLCAMICALYRERQERLPESPAELCEALVQMLLHRRERETPGLTGEHFLSTWQALQYQQKKGLLAELAVQMVAAGDSSVSSENAKRIVGEILDSTPGRDKQEAAEVLQALVERSGILRPAADDRIDFLHNTLKEYLAGIRFVEDDKWELLANRADDPAWQPVVLFALALAPEPFSSQLVRKLYERGHPPGSEATRTLKRRSLVPTKRDKIKQAESNARDFFLVRCRNAANRLAPALSDIIDNLTAHLFPPAFMHEAEALAQIGPRILRHAESSLLNSSWWRRQDARQASRCLRLLRLVGGHKAADVLRVIAHLPSGSSSLTGEWMLASSELCDGSSRWPFTDQKEVIADRARLTDLRPISSLSSLEILSVSQSTVEELTPLKGLTNLKRLNLSGTRVSDLTPLADHVSLETLNISYSNVRDIEPISKLAYLRNLNLDGSKIENLEPLRNFTQLERLDLDRSRVVDLAMMRELSKLHTLYLQRTGVTDLEPLSGLKFLEYLILNYSKGVTNLAPVANLPALRNLSLTGTGVTDISPLRMCSKLTLLHLGFLQLNDFTPLEELKSLRMLILHDSNIQDFSVIRKLPSLTSINIVGTKIPREEIDQFRIDRPSVALEEFRR